VLELVTMQKSTVVPHCPQMLQHALSGHEFSVLKSVTGGTLVVFGLCGPQTALGAGAGIGGYSLDKHIVESARSFSRPFHPQAFLLKLLIWLLVRLLAAPVEAQLCPDLTRYAEQ
jgi:hypothetical protein